MARRSYHFLTYTQRLKIEMRTLAGYTQTQIAAELGVHVSTISRELKRGRYEHLNTDLTTEWRYSPEIAEAKYREGLAAKGAPLKIGNRHDVAQFIERLILGDHYSPAAVCAVLKEEISRFGITFCRQTIYKYIDDGNIFPNVTNKDLPERGRRGKNYKKVTAKRAPRGRSIEERPPEILERGEFGHWEMDTIVGKSKTRARLLVLSERKTRKEIIMRIPSGETANVVRALDRLERRFGRKFSQIFRSITVDNGVEFSDCAGLERSALKKDKRTIVFYCHPYTSCERGTNENINKMIRRMFPKGTIFDKVKDSTVRAVEAWLNNYPRGILGYKSAATVFEEELKKIA